MSIKPRNLQSRRRIPIPPDPAAGLTSPLEKKEARLNKIIDFLDYGINQTEDGGVDNRRIHRLLEMIFLMLKEHTIP